MSVIRARNVQEAVALAAQMKAQGRYDWFRGQVQDWPLRSKFVRLSAKERAQALEKLARYEGWVKSTPGLESLAADTDAAIAVAQHYGLPTNFVDFTTEPEIAGFFASDRQPNAGHMSCILCLDTSDLLDLWQHLPNEYPAPELIRLQVPNLWRLEAQHGVFLYCPYDNVEQIYDLDRILFPYTGPMSAPAPDQIYPTRKSQLEVLLDQYFMNERLIAGTRHLYDMGILEQFTRIVADNPVQWDTDLLSVPEPSRLPSWHADNLRPWLSPHRERYPTVRTDLRIELGAPAQPGNPIQLRDSIRMEVQAGLISTPEIRSRLVHWVVRTETSHPAQEPDAFLSAALERLWDGLRVLPYSDAEIAASLANCVALAFANRTVPDARGAEPWERAATALFGDVIEVEFGADDGSYSRGYASREMLLRAVREDIGSLLNPAFKEQVMGNMTGLLQAMQAPDRLFDFYRLAQVFVHQLAPIQVLARPTSAAFFAPARLHYFRLP